MSDDALARLALFTAFLLGMLVGWIACESAHAGVYCDHKYAEYLEFAKHGAYDFQCEDKKGIGKATWEMNEVDFLMMKIFERLEKGVEDDNLSGV